MTQSGDFISSDVSHHAAVLESTPIGYAVIDRSYRFVYINRALAKQMNGLSIQTHVGKTIKKVLGEAPWMMIQPHIIRAFAGENVQGVEFYGEPVGRPGNEHHFLASYSPMKKNGRVHQVAVTVVDVTSQKTKELRASEHRFRTLVEQSPLSTQIFSPDGVTIQVNSAFTNMWNVTLEDLKDYNILNDSQLKRAGTLAMIKEAFAGKPMVLPTIEYDIDSTVEGERGKRYVRAVIYPIVNDEGKVSEVVLVHEDVSRQVQIEKELKRSSSQFQTILQHIADGISVQDAIGNLVFINEKAAVASGFDSAAQAISTTPAKRLAYVQARFEILDQQGNPFPLEQLPGRRAIREHKTSQALIQFVDKKTKKKQWSVVKSSPIISPEDDTALAVNIISDVTAQMEVERQLRAQQQQMASMLDSTAEGIYGVDAQGCCTFINASALAIFGFTREECIGHNMHELVHYKYPSGEPYPADECVVADALFSGKTVHLHEEILWHKNGSLINALTSFVPLMDGDTVTGGVVSIVDIREYKRAQEELETYKNRLELAQHAGHIGIFEWNLQTNALWWSTEEMILMGVDPSTFDGSTHDWQRSVHPDDFAKFQTTLTQAVENYNDYELEFRVIHPDGNVRWLKGRGQIYRDEEGMPLRIVGVNYDITARKQLENSLRFKAEASRVLGSTMQYHESIEKVAQLAVSYIADWCAVDLLTEEDSVELFTVAHKDPQKIAWARELRDKRPPDLSEPAGLPKVLREGTIEYYPVITDEMLVASAKTPEDLALLRDIGFSSLIIVPLKVGDKILGALTLANTESKRHFTESDVSFAEQIAARTALAIDNAMLYEQMHTERERINDIISNIPGVVWEAYGRPDDPQQRITYVSQYVERMLGYSVEDWLTKPNFWAVIVHPQDQERACNESVAIFESGTSGVSRFRWVAKSGKTYWVEAHSEVVVDGDNQPIGMRGVTMDITERVELEERKDAFISMASHELKTPVTSIKVFTQLLESMQKSSADSKQKQYLSRMHTQIDRLTHLISDLLDVSKMNTGKLELRKENFSFDELVRETVENLQPMTKKHQIHVTGKITKQVYGDRDRIGQVIINLLSNAVKYSPKADRVDIILEQKKNQVVCSVRDYGIGISSEHLPKIFERFYRVFESQEKTFPGLGMGLYISHEIIRRHDGLFTVMSTPGEGSMFTFTLPQALTKH